MLDALDKDGPINIKDLTLELPIPPTREPLFDPHRDLEPADVDTLFQIVQEGQNKSHISSEILAWTKIIAQKRFSKVKITEQLWDDLLKHAATTRQEAESYGPQFSWHHWDLYANDIANLKIIDSARVGNLGKDSMAREGMIGRIVSNYKPRAIQHYIEYAAFATIVDPEIKEALWLDERSFTRALQFINNKNKAIRNILDTVVGLRILYPDKEIEFDYDLIGLAKSELDELRKKAQENPQTSHYWMTFFEICTNLTLLSAQKLKVTEAGLEVINPSVDLALMDEKPLPLRRNF